MITYNYFGRERKIYYEKLDNGLDVYIIPNRNIKKYHVEVVTKYGSEIEKVKLSNGKYLSIPHGTAHFLEHKMFDMENEDGISYLSLLSIYANAGTNYFSTRYFIDGKKHFKEGLNYLLKMIFTPFFNDENIKKEMGIIEEEIKMYDDEPFWIIDNYFKNSFYKNILKHKISGTIEDIHQINADLLNKIYNIFYQPSNMFLVVSGNVSIKKTIDIIKNNKELNESLSNKKIVYDIKSEPKEVNDEYREIKLNVALPKVRYAFKFDLNDFKYQNKIYLRYYLNLIFSSCFGEGSIFDETVTLNHLSTYYYIDNFRKDNIYTFDIEAESEYADLFKEEIDKTINNIFISKEDFERVKKMWYSLIIKSLDSPEAIADSVINDILLNNSYIDQKEIIDNLKYEDINDIVKKMNFNYKTFMLVLPKE